MSKSSTSNINIKSRPLLNGETGLELNDYETAKLALDKIDEYQKINKAPAPIAPVFVQWLREGIKFVDDGQGSFVDYKHSNVLKQMDYDLVIANTERMNKEAEKKGAFDSKVVRTIKGESK